MLFEKPRRFGNTRGSLRDSLHRRLGFGLEDNNASATDTATELELEHTWYGRLVDRAVLDQAAKVERQEQWNMKPKLDEDMKYQGAARVRKVDDDKFFMCIKATLEGKRGVLETEFVINNDVFQAIKRLSNTGMIKTRYSFPIAGTSYSWEVDVFGDHEWVKVDLEVDDPNYEIPAMPFQLEGLIDGSFGKPSSEEQAVIDKLYENYFVTLSPYKGKE